MLRRVVLSFMVWVFAASAFSARMNADAANLIFQRANEEYQQQHFAEARNLYGQVVAAGIRSPKVFYNLGNAYARLGQIGPAVLNYERARQLDPQNADIAANLKRIAPPNNETQHFLLFRPYFWVVNHLSLRGWLGGFLALYIIACIGWAAYFLFPVARTRFWITTPLKFITVAAVLVGIFAAGAWGEYETARYGIIMKPDVRVYSGPGEKFVQIIAAPEGTKVRRLSSASKDWVHISVGEGQKGYVPANVIEEI